MDAAGAGEQHEQLVAFRLADSTFAVPIMLVLEVLRPGAAAAVAHSPAFVRGAITLHGEQAPVVDLRCRLGLPTVEDTSSTRVVIVETEAGPVGMVVDAVASIVRVPCSRLEPVARRRGQQASRATAIEPDLALGIAWVDETPIMVLNVERILCSGSAVGSRAERHIRRATESCAA